MCGQTTSRTVTGNEVCCEWSKLRRQWWMRSALFAQQPAEFIFLITAQFELLSVAQDHAMVTAKPGLDFANTLQVDDGGTMNAHKFRGIELAFHLAHVAAQQMRRTIAVQAQIVSFGFDPIQVAYVQEQKPALE